MKKIALIMATWLCVMAAMAQVPHSFTYQAVVRNDSNRLVSNAVVGILAGIYNSVGNMVYQERHTAETNENGLLTIEIGNGESISGNIHNIQWGSDAYYLHTSIDPKGGSDYAITINQRLLSVPYALYANEAGNVFSGDYNDLANKPELFSGDYNDLTNTPNFATVATTGNYNDLSNTPNLATVATTGSYNDLIDTPILATVATTGNYNDLNNTPDLAAVATTGSYNSLDNTPNIPTLPSQVSSFTNDAGYITQASVVNILNALYQRIDSLQQFIADNISCCNANTTGIDTIPSCPGTPMMIDYDGNVYRTVQIGNQCWSRENLKTTHYADGTTVANLFAPNNNEENVSVYGYLYNLNATTHNAPSSTANPSGVQGVCPIGWHVPSDAEWTQLTDFVSTQSQHLCNGNSNNIAKALSSKILWVTNNISCNVGNSLEDNNTTGFSALPAGMNNNFFSNRAYFWSATMPNSNSAVARYLSSNSETVFSYNSSISALCSVRCVKD